MSRISGTYFFERKLITWLLSMRSVVDRYKLFMNEIEISCATQQMEQINYFKKIFGDALISRNSDIDWHPRSHNLTPLQVYIVSSHLVNLAFEIKLKVPFLIYDLIKWQKVFENWVHRILSCRSSRGGHLTDI